MRYLSVCSGIEAATVAWHHLGWTPAAFSEIEPFPSAVLAHHYPSVPNLGDMTNFKEWNLGPVDLLVGGTPCQSFSVAGLRKGLHDPRGGLMLTFLEIAQRYRPRWVVWENVPGVLSSNGGRDFGAFLGALGELGYGWAYRVLDAQWFGVAQRRRRVFVVGCLGDQASAAAVLFESESVCRYFEKSGKARQGVARGVGGGPEGGSISGAVTRKWAKGSGGPAGDECYNMVAQPVATFAKTHKPMSSTDPEGWSPVDTAPTVTHGPRDRSDAGTDVAVVYERHDQDARVKEVSVAPTLHSKSDNTCDLPMVMQPVGTDCYNGAITGDVAATIGTPGSSVNASGPTVMQPVAQPVAFEPESIARNAGPSGESALAPTLRREMGDNQPAVRIDMQVRRLTPVECERLQGFPDGYTNIPWRKKPEAPDGPRYKALGNSMAVPCMRWIGERIQAATARQEVKP